MKDLDSDQCIRETRCSKVHVESFPESCRTPEQERERASERTKTNGWMNGINKDTERKGEEDRGISDTNTKIPLATQE